MKKKIIMIFSLVMLLFVGINASSNDSFVIELDSEKFIGQNIEAFLNEDKKDELVQLNNSLIQESVERIEEALGREIEISASGNYIFCFISTDLTDAEVKKVEKLDYVKSVSIENTHKVFNEQPMFRVMSKSADDIHALDLMGIDKSISDKYDGRGKVVAVIDGNFNPEHPIFKLDDGVETKIKKADVEKYVEKNPTKFKNAKLDELYISDKVPFGFHYINENARLNPEKDSVGHGQHVAGIAVGNKALVNDKYNFMGVARNAQLLTLSVFSNGRTASSFFLEALNDAVYFNADVVNMSFGAPKATIKGYNSADLKVKEVINTIAKKTGTTVVIAAGNEGEYDGDLSINYPEIGNMASPGIVDGSITVAAVENGFYLGQAMELAGKTINYNRASSMSFEKGRYFFADCKKALSVEDCKPARGRVALIERGDNNFSQKIKNAKEAGAIGVIIYNNMPGELLMSIEGEDSIPAYSVNMEDGKFMLENIDSAIEVDAEEKLLQNPNAGRISAYSNWGITADGELKPDIAAPGSNIYSANNEGGFVTKTGTSMAAPHISGGVAILSQAIDDMDRFKSVELAQKSDLIKTLMMNSAEPITDKDTNANVSPRKQGAGLVNLKKALELDFTVVDANTGRPSSFIKNVDEGFDLKLKVKNYSGEKKTLKPSYVFSIDDRDGLKNLMRPKLLFTESKDETFEIPAKSEKEISIRIDFKNLELLDEYKNGAFIDGFVSLNDGEKSATIPVVTFKGDLDSHPLVEKPIYKMDFENEFPMYWNLKPRLNLWHKFMTHVETEYDGKPVIAGMVNFDDVDSKKKDGKDLKPVFEDVVLSPNNDGKYDKFNVISVVTRTAEFELKIEDKAGKEIYNKKMPEYSYKNISNFADSTIYAKRELGYTMFGEIDLNDLEEGEYVLKIVGTAVSEGAKQVVEEIPFAIDKTAPKIINKNKRKTHLEFEVEDESTVRVYKQYEKEDGVYYPYPEWPDYAVPKFVEAYEEIPMKDGKYSLDLEEFTSETIIKIVDAGRNEFVETIDKLTTDEKLYDFKIIARTSEGKTVPVKYDLQDEKRNLIVNSANLKAGKYMLSKIEAPLGYKLVSSTPEAEYGFIVFEVGEGKDNEVILNFEEEAIGKRLVVLNGSGLLSFNDFEVIATGEDGKEYVLKPEIPNTPQYYLTAPYGKYKLSVRFIKKEIADKYEYYFSKDEVEIDSPEDEAYTSLYFKENKYRIEPVTIGYDKKVDYIGLNLNTGFVRDIREVGYGKTEVAPKEIPEGYYVVPGVQNVLVDENNPIARPEFKFIKDEGKTFKLFIKDNAEERGIDAQYLVLNFNERFNVGVNEFEKPYTPGMELKPGWYIVKAIQQEDFSGKVIVGADAEEPDATFELYEKIVECYEEKDVEIGFKWYKASDPDRIVKYGRKIEVTAPEGFNQDLVLELKQVSSASGGELQTIEHVYKFDDESTHSVALEEGQYSISLKNLDEKYECDPISDIWVFGAGGFNIIINIKAKAGVEPEPTPEPEKPEPQPEEPVEPEDPGHFYEPSPDRMKKKPVAKIDEKREEKKEEPKQEETKEEVKEEKKKIITKFTLDSKNFSANDNTNMMDVEPFAKEGRIMVPIRFVGMALGFDVSWDQATQTAILTNGEVIIKIPMNGKTFYVNDTPFVADAEPEVRSQRIFLSISNIAKALGLEEGKEIFWDQSTKTATFIYNK